MEQNNDKFEEIVKDLKEDEAFNVSTQKIARSFSGGKKLALGIALILVGLLAVVGSISLFAGLLGTVLGVISFIIVLTGGLVAYDGKKLGKSSLPRRKLLDENSPFMRKMSARWEDHVSRRESDQR